MKKSRLGELMLNILTIVTSPLAEQAMNLALSAALKTWWNTREVHIVGADSDLKSLLGSDRVRFVYPQNVNGHDDNTPRFSYPSTPLRISLSSPDKEFTHEGLGSIEKASIAVLLVDALSLVSLESMEHSRDLITAYQNAASKPIRWVLVYDIVAAPESSRPQDTHLEKLLGIEEPVFYRHDEESLELLKRAILKELFKTLPVVDQWVRWGKERSNE